MACIYACIRERLAGETLAKNTGYVSQLSNAVKGNPLLDPYVNLNIGSQMTERSIVTCHSRSIKLKEGGNLYCVNQKHTCLFNYNILNHLLTVYGRNEQYRYSYSPLQRRSFTVDFQRPHCVDQQISVANPTIDSKLISYSRSRGSRTLSCTSHPIRQ